MILHIVEEMSNIYRGIADFTQIHFQLLYMEWYSLPVIFVAAVLGNIAGINEVTIYREELLWTMTLGVGNCLLNIATKDASREVGICRKQ